jgi:PleD family two-component response regulator
MITAISDGADKISALRYGADDYVVKPTIPQKSLHAFMLSCVVMPGNVAGISSSSKI